MKEGKRGTGRGGFCGVLHLYTRPSARGRLTSRELIQFPKMGWWLQREKETEIENMFTKPLEKKASQKKEKSKEREEPRDLYSHPTHTLQNETSGKRGIGRPVRYPNLHAALSLSCK